MIIRLMMKKAINKNIKVRKDNIPNAPIFNILVSKISRAWSIFLGTRAKTRSVMINQRIILMTLKKVTDWESENRGISALSIFFRSNLK